MTLPPITESALANGLSLVTVERRDLPLVTLRLVIPTGSVRDPAGKEGLASMTAQLLRRGARHRTADQLDDAIESIGGLLSVEAGPETTTLGATVPAEHAAAALGVLATLVREPSFPQAEFASARRRELARLQSDLDDPSGLADTALAEFFYGAKHPYGHPGQGRTASVKALRRTDVVAFHKRTYTPQGALLLMVGDIAAAEAAAAAQQHLGDWKGAALAPLDIPAPTEAPEVQLLLVDKPDATQAQVRMAVPGIARHDPTFHAATVANTIVGGGFTSRLVDEVRVNRGLSYSVSTRLSALRHFGAVVYSTFTKTATVREIIDVSLGVMERLQSEPPAADEIDKARRYVIGLYPARVEGSEHLADVLASARYLGLPFEAISRYRSDVAASSTEQVAAAMALFPSHRRARIVVVGNAAAIRPQLQGLGNVTVRPATDFQ